MLVSSFSSWKFFVEWTKCHVYTWFRSAIWLVPPEPGDGSRQLFLWMLPGSLLPPPVFEESAYISITIVQNYTTSFRYYGDNDFIIRTFNFIAYVQMQCTWLVVLIQILVVITACSCKASPLTPIHSRKLDVWYYTVQWRYKLHTWTINEPHLPYASDISASEEAGHKKSNLGAG